MIVLDQATSALDGRAEEELTTSLSRLKEKKSVGLIFITQKLEGLQLCEQIIVL